MEKEEKIYRNKISYKHMKTDKSMYYTFDFSRILKDIIINYRP